MAAEQVNIGSWLLRVLAWDGLLPVGIAILSAAISLVIPNNRGAIEVTAVALPIGAFLVRFYAGRRHIASNHCGKAIQGFQFCIFCVGILMLLAIDALMILSRIMPPGALFATKTDWLMWGILILVYLTSMTIAMYPGRT